MNRKIILSVLPMAVIWLAALIFAGFYDLPISLAVADPMSTFGRLLEIIGEVPAILFTSFNFSLIAVCLLKRGTHKDRLLATLSIIGAVGTAYYTSNATLGYIRDWRADLGLGFMNDSLKLFLALLMSAMISTLFLYIAFRMDSDRLTKFLPAAAHCVLAAVLTLVIIWALKLVWGRVRFRQLEDISMFTPFWHPNGYNGYFSFPSGHTANATVVLTLLYYSDFMKHKGMILSKVLTVWVFIVALSRVLVGAHYLSDVLCGAAVTAVIVYLCRPSAAKKEA